MSHNIPRTQRAAIVVSPDAPIYLKDDYPVKQPDELAPGECLIKVQCNGVCHTDLHTRKGAWPLAPKLPLIGGHEGVDCSEAKLGGYTLDGTFSQYLVSYVSHVTPTPENLNSEEAASFLCAGVTVYRALEYNQTKPGDWIVLPGGLGLAVQDAVRAFGLAQIGASVFWTVVKSINIIGSYIGVRQVEDAQEALNIASLGKIKCHFVLKPLSALSEVYEGMEQGTLVGRVVLKIE